MFQKSFYILLFIFNILPYGNINIDIEESLSFYEKNEFLFKDISSNLNLDAKTVASIGLPEVIRYNEWQNVIENKALHYFYISGGKEKADFSIGPFQMKPSFIENLECKIVSDNHLIILFNDLIPNGNLSEENKRKFRLNNLGDLKMQFKYLCAYFLIMEIMYGSELIKKEEKIKFYASAYNFGFTRKKENIRAWIKKKKFPYGGNFNFKQDSYPDVSYSIYTRLKFNNCP